MKVSPTRIAALSLLLAFGADAADYKSELDKKIKAAQDVGILGDDLAGDEVNFYTGATKFKATDISVPGNAFSINLTRTFAVEYESWVADVRGPTIGTHIESVRTRAFGDWDLDVPRISTTMSQLKGWAIDSDSPMKRCSVVGQLAGKRAATGAPPNVQETFRLGIGPARYWSGYTLHVPGGEQPLLVASLPNSERPVADIGYHWTTNQDWWVSCLPATANTVNNDGGEAFLVRAPDGTTYTFNWLSRQNISHASETFTDPLNDKAFNKTAYVHRAEFSMLPTLVVDRFGNWMRYTWSNDAFARLLSISAGKTGQPETAEQLITLTYNSSGFVDSATDGARIWRYSYSGPSLVGVILPDGSQWKYGLGGLLSFPPQPACEGDPTSSEQWYWACFGGGLVPSAPLEAAVTHPSGAVINFTFDNHFQYAASGKSSYPLGLVRKTISGPGLSPATWKLGYLPSKDEIKAACQAGSCPVRIMTDQLAPDGSLTRRVFGLLAQRDETNLLGELRGSLAANGGGSPAITTSARWGSDILDDVSPVSSTVPVFYSELDNRYVPPEQATAYTIRVGINPLGSVDTISQVFASERRLPTVSRITTQQNVVFTSESNSFDKFARPVRVTRLSTGSSAGNFSRSESMTFHDDVNLWVLGQPATVTNDQPAKQVSRTEYDASTALPLRNYKFNILQESLTYSADGAVKTVRDGAGNELALDGWYRGVPKLIRFANMSTITAAVNPDGSIESVIDPLSNKTSYTYDAMGRMKSIRYPVGDTTEWNDTVQAFSRMESWEYGIPPGHWKQTVSNGAGETATFLDARWRPILTVTQDTSLGASKTFIVRRFDALGREVFASYPVGSLASVNDALDGVTTSFDALGRAYRVSQSSELGALTSLSEFLPGFRLRSTNPRGYQTTTSYQVFDKPDTSRPVEIVAPEGVITTISRDVYGKPTQVTRSSGG